MNQSVRVGESVPSKWTYAQARPGLNAEGAQPSGGAPLLVPECTLCKKQSVLVDEKLETEENLLLDSINY